MKLMKLNMHKTNLILFTLLLNCTLLFAQQEGDTIQADEPVNTIDQQFTDLIEKSNNYQDYKVVKRFSLNQLQKNTRDSINNLKTEINTLNQKISDQESKINQLNASLEETQGKLDATRSEKDSINFLGIQMSKGGYKSLMWGVIALLALALLFFIYKFKGSNAHTREAQQKLNEVEEEYDQYRKKALEKEQKMGRLLQDERNKLVKQKKG